MGDCARISSYEIMTASVIAKKTLKATLSRSRIQLSIESRLDQVCLLRTAVRAIAAELGFDESSCLEIQLGVTEAVNNVIEHAYHGHPGCRVALDIDTGPDFLDLRITDDGAPLPLDYLTKCLGEPSPFPEPGDAEQSDRRRGLWIIRQIMDSVRFDRKDGKNHLYLSKKVPAGLSQSGC
jgi:serine/threonine-protein kinase RsbW